MLGSLLKLVNINYYCMILLCRMTSTWKLLFKAVLQYMSSNDVSAQAMRQAHTLKQALEQNFVEMDIDMEPVQIPEISSGKYIAI